MQMQADEVVRITIRLVDTCGGNRMMQVVLIWRTDFYCFWSRLADMDEEWSGVVGFDASRRQSS